MSIMASNTSNKGLLFTIIILLLIAIAIGGYMAYHLTYQQTSLTPTPSITSVPTSAPPNIPTNPLPTTSQSMKPKSDKEVEAITKALALKHNKSVNETRISVSQNTGTHATGSVSFEGEAGGGMWLATTEQGIWTIVFDGNGVVPCADIAPYNFPVDMVPTCFDEGVGDIVNR